MQPAYLPWLGYFNRIALSDLYVVLDHVQIDKNSKTKFANRNKIRTKDNWCWLTVPIKTKGKSEDLAINKLEISNDNRWIDKHFSAIKFNYGKASFFKEHEEFFEKVYFKQEHYLINLIMEMNNYLLSALNIKKKVIYSSEMDIDCKKGDLILKICKAVGAQTYISGPFGKDYLNGQLFQQEGVEIVYHNYKHPIYAQSYPGFEPYMSVIDLLFNCGDMSYKILMQGQGGLSSER